MAYANQELKTKVLKLIKGYTKDKKINIKLNSKIIFHAELKVNISACSIDLRQNLIQTQKATLRKMERLGGYNCIERKVFENALNQNINICTERMELRGLAFNAECLDLYFSGDALELIRKVVESIKCNHYDNFGSPTDYYDAGYYWDLSIGKNKGGFITTY